MKLLITGSSGLIGGEAVQYFDSLGWSVIGVDNNQRAEFFGPAGDTLWNLHRVAHNTRNFTHEGIDIRKYEELKFHTFEKHGPFDAVIHCAAQPSHDKSREIPLTDFAVNAVGTLNLLELTRLHSSNAVFIYMSTNKVYGDAPNEKLLVELPTRFEYAKLEDRAGIDETCRIDQSTHSVFGASKVAADVMVQEYGRQYGLKTTVFRGGCLTGPGHSGVELHGFLSYLVKTSIQGKTYKIYGYKGKQVRDNIHSRDVVRAMHEVIKNPRVGEVYNLGGGRDNSVSVLEAISKIENLIGKPVATEYVDQNRIGDHICYISDLTKFQSHYPEWFITKSLDDTLEDIVRQQYWGNYVDTDKALDFPLTDTSLVLDIGGFRGSWSAAIRTRYNSRILLFEPIKEYAQACAHRLSGVQVNNFGFSDCDQEVEVTRNEIHTSQFTGDRAEIEKILLRDIVGFLDERNIQSIDLAALNCEGGEYNILRRLINSGYISRFKNILIQFHNFYPEAHQLREELRRDLAKTHKESFCYLWTWESWERK